MVDVPRRHGLGSGGRGAGRHFAVGEGGVVVVVAHLLHNKVGHIAILFDLLVLVHQPVARPTGHRHLIRPLVVNEDSLLPLHPGEELVDKVVVTDLPVLDIVIDLLLVVPGQQFVELQVSVEEIHYFMVVVFLKEVLPLVLGGRV